MALVRSRLFGALAALPLHARLTPAMVALDVAFQALVLAGYFNAVGTVQAPLGYEALDVALAVAGATGVVWLAASVACLRRFRGIRDLDERGADEVVAMGASLERLPLRYASLWSARWAVEFAVLSVIAGDPASRASQVSLELAMFVGPSLLAHALAVWFSRHERDRIARRLLALRVAPAWPTSALRTRLVAYGVAFAVTPSLYIGAFALSPAPADAKVWMVGSFAVTIGLWGALNALLLSSVVIGPVAEVGQTLHAIAREGTARDASHLVVARLDEVGVVVDATNTMVDRLGDAERARAAATRALEALTRALERQVAERTADLRLVLDNVPDAFLCVDAEGRLVGARSRQAEAWFGEPFDGELVWSYVGQDDPQFAGVLETLWPEAMADALPAELVLSQCPAVLRSGPRTLRVGFRVVDSGAEPRRVVVVLHDVTAEIEAERGEVDQRDAATLLAHLVRDRGGVSQMITEAERILTELEDGSPSSGRLIHTLKGNAAMFGLRGVASTCQLVEGEAEGASRDATPGQIEEIRAHFERVTADARAVLGATRDAAFVTAHDLDELVAAIQRGEPARELARRVSELRGEPIHGSLERMAEHARLLAERLGKGTVDVTVECADVRVAPERCGPLLAALVHAVRNAVDHGIEEPAERITMGKRPIGAITLRASVAGGDLRIELADDGRGVSWEAVAARARAAGLPAASRADLEEALFADGLSTAARVTDVSGRGVGLAALRAIARERGGDVTVASTPGRGTTLVVAVPFEARAASDAAAPESGTRAKAGEIEAAPLTMKAGDLAG